MKFITFLKIFWGQENIGQNFLTEGNLAFWGNKVETLNYLENKGTWTPRDAQIKDKQHGSNESYHNFFITQLTILKCFE